MNESPPNERGRYPWVIWCVVRWIVFGYLFSAFGPHDPRPTWARGHVWRIWRRAPNKRVRFGQTGRAKYQDTDCVCDWCGARWYDSGLPLSAIDQLGNLVK